MNTPLVSIVSGTVWKIEVAVGQRVARGHSLLLVESMKMEIPLEAPSDGAVLQFHVAEGDTVAEGQTVASFSTV